LTGASGFVGSYIYKELIKCGYNNVIPLRNSSSYNKDAIYCNLTDMGETHKIFSLYKPDVVIHTAAQVAGIGGNSKYPGDFFYNNIKMGINVVDNCRMHGVAKLVFLSTVCSYPKYASVPFIEEDVFTGEPEPTNAAYAYAKRAIYQMIVAYNKQFNLNGITLLPSNMYGPNETNLDIEDSHVIPALIIKILKAKKDNDPSIKVWGSGNATREFLYVEDCAKAIVAAMEQYDSIQPINIGTGIETPIVELVESICNIIGYNGNIIYDSSKPDGQPRRCLNVSKAKKEFGFTAETKLYDGLEKTIKWLGKTIK
jgi:GDP-L-fucose synthase